jgi:CheY-like chemotaxis protein
MAPPYAVCGEKMLPNAQLVPNGRRVLVVDDHVDSADIIAHVLSLNGYDARAAYEPLSAISVAAEFEPHVVIVDIKLPTMDGYQLSDALSVQFPACRFIALTGDTATLNGLRSRLAGFHGHLTKPVALPDLLSAVSDTRLSGTFERTSPSPTETRSNETSRPPRERSRIDLHGTPEIIRYWTTDLCCTEAQLRAAVDAVGVDSEEVRRYLRVRRA